ncbi:hypothetical protein G6009_14830 [Dietzia sp. SLG510A3-30A2]|nr:hypothetical protein [Dietzia sp. SLG510A3-30A2]
MKNAKRMMAVIAASGLALGSMPGIANAQGSEGLLDLNLDLVVGQSVDLGVNLGLGSLGVDPSELTAGEFPALTGSLDDLDGAGSDDLAAGSDDFGPALEEALEAGSAGGSGSDTMLAGTGSDELTAGSTDEAGDLDFGSLTAGSTDEAGDLDFGSLESITDSFDSLSAGSTDEAGDLDFGSDGTDIFLGSDAAGLATIGSLAAAGIGIGLAVSGGVNLPPLPEINVGLVCNLPQEGIDFLKYNGSMEQDECEPVEEQN